MAVRKEQMPVEKEKKIRIPLWIYPSVEDRIMKNFEADNCKSPSEFIEKATLDNYTSAECAFSLAHAIRTCCRTFPDSTTNVTFITSPPLQTPNPGIDSILTPTTT